MLARCGFKPKTTFVTPMTLEGYLTAVSQFPYLYRGKTQYLSYRLFLKVKYRKEGIYLVQCLT